MLCAVVIGPDYKKNVEQISLLPPAVDIIELRIDCFESKEISEIAQLKALAARPVIFTLRSVSQGGRFEGSEEARLNFIHQLARLEPDYFDLEWDIPLAWILAFQEAHPQVRLIVSYHNTLLFPEDFDPIYQHLTKISACHYKIAVRVSNQIEALSLLSFSRSHSRLSVMPMGMNEEPVRILNPIFNCPLNYACLNENSKVAKGQFSVEELLKTYHYSQLNSSTKIFALIGEPVELSISHETHNHLFHELGINAVYVKFPLAHDKQEFKEFLQKAKELNFSGLSVTSPLKETAYELIDECDDYATSFKAINTIHFSNGLLKGFNTDGFGAINAIEQMGRVKGKKLLIIGAGATGRAIAHEGARRGAKIVLLNRHAETAINFAKSQALIEYAGGLDELKKYSISGYDIIINATNSEMPIDETYILPDAIAMDVKTKPKMTQFLSCAADRGCTLVPGYKMFIEQALGQFAIWFNHAISQDKARSLLETKALTIL